MPVGAQARLNATVETSEAVSGSFARPHWAEIEEGSSSRPLGPFNGRTLGLKWLCGLLVVLA